LPLFRSLFSPLRPCQKWWLCLASMTRRQIHVPHTLSCKASAIFFMSVRPSTLTSSLSVLMVNTPFLGFPFCFILGIARSLTAVWSSLAILVPTLVVPPQTRRRLSRTLVRACAFHGMTPEPHPSQRLSSPKTFRAFGMAFSLYPVQLPCYPFGSSVSR